MLSIKLERVLRRALIIVALTALGLGLLIWGIGHVKAAKWIWAMGTFPVAAALLVSMIRDFVSGRVGVDAIAFVSMSAALLLGETLAGVVVAVMYAGGNMLEDFAVARAERDLKSLIDRAPRVAHRWSEGRIEDVAIEEVAVGDSILVRGGEIIPVDGVITSAGAMLDEAALTGEPIPVHRRKGEAARSGTLNAGETFEMRASATAGESTYAGIVRLVTALGGQDQDRRRFEGGPRPQLLDQCHAVHIGHIDVGDDQIDTGAVQHRQCLDAIIRFNHFVACAAQGKADHVAHRLRIVDGQYPFGCQPTLHWHVWRPRPRSSRAADNSCESASKVKLRPPSEKAFTAASRS